MSMIDREAEVRFSQPVRQIFLMLVAIGLFSFGAYLAYPRVAPVFLANPYLNGAIAVVFIVGVMTCILQVVQLVTLVSWIEGFAAERPGHELTRAPRLLAPLAALMRSRGHSRQISTSSARSILDSVATRIEEQRDITRYIVNLLIFLGLLGTFYGLATTVPALVDTIRSLAPKEGEGGVEVFGRLMGGLEAQLGGMGTAFASSLLGLAGSLVVGLLELFAGHGQNRFYRELEEWLSTITRLGFASGEAGDAGEGAADAVIEQMAGQMDMLQAVFVDAEASRAAVDERIGVLADAVGQLADRLEAEAGTAATLARIAEGQERLIGVLEGRGGDGGGQMDAESRMRLRSIDVQLLRILEEISAGRQESLTDLRSDLAALTRAIRQRNTERGG